MNEVVIVLTVLAALGSGLIGGVFFAFSSFIMQALAQLAPEHGVEAMQRINRTVLNAWFLGIFAGTALLGVVLTVVALLNWHWPGAAYLLAGGLLYGIGTFAITGIRNVPLNETLAKVEPETSEATALWVRYLREWTFWNHVRTVAACLATVAFILALRQL